MSDTVLQILFTAIVGIMSAFGAYKVGITKTKIDAKIATTSASDALRDDLLGLVDKYEAREKTLIDRLERNEKRNEELQRTISDLSDQIIILRRENAELKAELQRTSKDLEEFNRRVYYIPNKTQE
jgi:chromosome segregation ATPase